jgi:hypothetical protein
VTCIQTILFERPVGLRPAVDDKRKSDFESFYKKHDGITYTYGEVVT